jgi:hypothetical protein
MPPRPASHSHCGTQFALGFPSSVRSRRLARPHRSTCVCPERLVALSFSSNRPARLPIYHLERDITHVESTLLQVLIPPHLISRRINTYKKNRGRGLSASLQDSQLVTAPHPRTSLSLSVPSVHAGSRATPIRSNTSALFRAQRGCGYLHTPTPVYPELRGANPIFAIVCFTVLFAQTHEGCTPWG